MIVPCVALPQSFLRSASVGAKDVPLASLYSIRFSFFGNPYVILIIYVNFNYFLKTY